MKRRKREGSIAWLRSAVPARMLPKIQLKMNAFILLFSLLTRDEEIEDEKLRLATTANCFVQEVGRASELRKRIEDGKKIINK